MNFPTRVFRALVPLFLLAPLPTAAQQPAPTVNVPAILAPAPAQAHPNTPQKVPDLGGALRQLFR